MRMSVSLEARIFLLSVLCGGVLVLCYDLFRVVRTKAKTKGAMLHVQDGLFWVLALFILFYFVLFVNNGRVRFYELAGMILGAVIYALTLSRPIYLGICKILESIMKIFSFFLKIILTPLRFMYNIIFGYICFAYMPVKRVLRRLKEGGLAGVRRLIRFSQKK